MKWISVKDTTPILREMLVFCKDCKHIHAVYRDYDEYSLPEWCDEDGLRCPGKSIEFDWYMPLPEPPEKK